MTNLNQLTVAELKALPAHKFVPALLFAAGWDAKRVTGLAAAIDRKRAGKHLTQTQKRDLAVFRAVQEKELDRLTRLARQAEANGDITKKTHYRWVQEVLNYLENTVELEDGKVCLDVVAAKLHLEHLRKFNPTLDMVDTNNRNKIYEVIDREIDFFAEAGETVNITRTDIRLAIKEVFAAVWNPAWDNCWQRETIAVTAVDAETAAVFEEILRENLFTKAEKFWPSVARRQAAK